MCSVLDLTERSMLPPLVDILLIWAIRQRFGVKFAGKDVAQPQYMPKGTRVIVNVIFEFYQATQESCKN